MSAEPLPGRRKFVRNLAVGLTVIPMSGMTQVASTGAKSRASGQADRRYIPDVRDFGAVADGKTLTTT